MAQDNQTSETPCTCGKAEELAFLIEQLKGSQESVPVEAEYEVLRNFDWGSDSFERGEVLKLNPEDPIVNGLAMSSKIRRLDRVRLIERQKELQASRQTPIVEDDVRGEAELAGAPA